MIMNRKKPKQSSPEILQAFSESPVIVMVRDWYKSQVNFRAIVSPVQ